MVSLAPAATKRAAIYCRVSTDDQAERGHSLDSQERACRQYANEIGASIIGSYVDAGVSGARWDAPALMDLLKAARERAFDVLVCLDPDRLSRSVGKLAVVEEELRATGVTIQYVNLRVGDDAEGRLMVNIRGAFSEYERFKTALRTQTGRREKAAKGLVIGSRQPPLGYAFGRDQWGKITTLVIDPATAPIVRRIFEDISRMTADRVAEGLNRDGIVTSRGGVWRQASILDLVRHPVYRGRYPWFRRKTASGRRRDDHDGIAYVDVPALVDGDLWDAAQTALAHRKLSRERSDPKLDPFMLRGMLTCGHCGGALSRNKIGRGFRYYFCTRHFKTRADRQGKDICPLPMVGAQVLEDAAWSLLSATLLDPDHLRKGMADTQARAAEAEQQRTARLSTIDREMDKHRKRLRRMAEELADADDDEIADAKRGVMAASSAALKTLQADREAIEQMTAPGLSTSDVAAIVAFAQEMSDGLSCATVQDRRRLIETLRLIGTIRLDENGSLPVGKYRFSVDWRAAIDLSAAGVVTEPGISASAQRYHNKPTYILAFDSGASAWRVSA